ncbi:cell division protein FtsW [Phragmitibacter flavus]|uniref:Probable peptidoglycan glycosyltransferase FtsW n=1 Tax=Phragmitibacter flavus TaxID=2576071 RepID=A0A5R8K9K4_9BACT|nr:putative peptidoglycan glycosyltransferase FtsW [Phragmitibacter flavus]TLD68988.1 cell division protein FtsW [Phragmitibacter flavus]
MNRASVYLLISSVCLLVLLGIVMLASTSFFVQEKGGAAYTMLWQQGMWVVVSLFAAVFFAWLPYGFLFRFRWWIFGVTLITLVLCFVPYVGVEVNGASRWIGLSSLGLPMLQFQPSEMAKLACVIVLAGWFARHAPLTREFLPGFLIPGVVVVVPLLLVGMEVDLGSAVLIGALGGGMMFVAGTRWIYLVPVGATLLAGLYGVVKLMPNRVERIMAFMDLEKFKDGLGLQQWRAMIAFGSGGVDGVGLGNGRQKMMGLPEAHTDFIFPMVGEELGFGGAIFVVLLFVTILVAGFNIAQRAQDRFGKLLAFGITLIMALEALMNMGVTTALLPNKGLPLPFVSKGGSSLLFAMIGIGILVNIHRHGMPGRKNDLPLTRRRRMSTASHSHGSL